MEKNQIEFLTNSTNKMISNIIERGVSKKLKTLDDDTNLRRNRLKDILSQEIKELSIETELKKSEDAKKNYERKKIKALEIETNRNLARKQIAEKKIIQLTQENSEEKYLMEEKEKLNELAKAREYQIWEKKKIQEMEKDLDNIWIEIMNKYYDTKVKEEENAERVRKNNKQIYHQILMDQINDKRLALKEEQYLSAIEVANNKKEFDRYKNDVEKELEMKMEIKQSLSELKDTDYKVAVELKKKQKEEEKMLNKYYNEKYLNFSHDNSEELQKRKANQRLELDLFKDDLIKRRNEFKRMDEIEDQMRNREIELLQEKLDRIKLMEEIAKQTLCKDVMKIRMEQIVQKNMKTDNTLDNEEYSLF